MTTTPTTLTFPTTTAIYNALMAVRQSLRAEHAENDIDVRLQVTSTGWTLHTGDSSYDLDHHGFWGTTTVGASDTSRLLRSMADDLREQAQDAAATMASWLRG
jgi:hypothetical protein